MKNDALVEAGDVIRSLIHSCEILQYLIKIDKGWSAHGWSTHLLHCNFIDVSE